MVRRKKRIDRKDAEDRVGRLFGQADSVYGEDRSLSDRYIYLGRKLAMKARVRLSSVLKRRFCPSCYRYLRPGVNCRVRLYRGRLVYSCLLCKKQWRMPVGRR
ncbi:ribonuclease P [Candidatus Woesearchaeota archaeon]|nr:ribonuclease P [Candidatus Woesearchaeota archaeon]